MLEPMSLLTAGSSSVPSFLTMSPRFVSASTVSLLTSVTGPLGAPPPQFHLREEGVRAGSASSRDLTHGGVPCSLNLVAFLELVRVLSHDEEGVF